MAARVLQYDFHVTFNTQKNTTAVLEGYYYTVDANGLPVLADNATPLSAIGFAVKGAATVAPVSAAANALCSHGVVEYDAADVAGNGGVLTPGSTVWLGAGGKPTTVKPSTNAYMQQALGVALVNNVVAVNVSAAPILFQTAGTSTVSM